MADPRSHAAREAASEQIQRTLCSTIRNTRTSLGTRDHSIFLQAGRPAIAVSSNWFIENFSNQDITHTPKDNLEIVSYERIVEAVEAIMELI